MAKKLAIQGHASRGKEVIELLEMMGGKNFSNLGNDELFYYYIDDKNNIDFDCTIWDINDRYTVFTIEEFLNKYPFKVGDFVRIPEYESEVRICKMKWTPFSDIEYLVYRNDDEEWYTAKELLEYNDHPNKTRDCKKCGLHFGSVRCFAMDCPHNKPKSYAVGLKDGKVIDCNCITNKKTDMNKNNREVINMTKETITPPPDITANVIDKNNCDIACPDGYEFYDENGNLIGNKVMMRPKKPKYPKTYKECCDVLGIDTMDNDAKGYKHFLVIQFQELLIARDAYWKMAGEQMGLGKSWEPDWNWCEYKFCIGTIYDEIERFHAGSQNCMLAFPTEEMRDAFYENFKDLIERCKEML